MERSLHHAGNDFSLGETGWEGFDVGGPSFRPGPSRLSAPSPAGRISIGVLRVALRLRRCAPTLSANGTQGGRSECSDGKSNGHCTTPENESFSFRETGWDRVRCRWALARPDLPPPVGTRSRREDFDRWFEGGASTSALRAYAQRERYARRVGPSAVTGSRTVTAPRRKRELLAPGDRLGRVRGRPGLAPPGPSPACRHPLPQGEARLLDGLRSGRTRLRWSNGTRKSRSP